MITKETAEAWTAKLTPAEVNRLSNKLFMGSTAFSKAVARQDWRRQLTLAGRALAEIRRPDPDYVEVVDHSACSYRANDKAIIVYHANGQERTFVTSQKRLAELKNSVRQNGGYMARESTESRYAGDEFQTFDVAYNKNDEILWHSPVGSYLDV